MIWEDKVSQEFVDITIKYLEEDAPLGDIDYDPYVKTTDEKFRDDISTGYRDRNCGMKCKNRVWHFHEEKNDTESAKEKLAMFENEFSENSKNSNNSKNRVS